MSSENTTVPFLWTLPHEIDCSVPSTNNMNTEVPLLGLLGLIPIQLFESHTSGQTHDKNVSMRMLVPDITFKRDVECSITLTEQAIDTSTHKFIFFFFLFGIWTNKTQCK